MIFNELGVSNLIGKDDFTLQDL